MFLIDDELLFSSSAESGRGVFLSMCADQSIAGAKKFGSSFLEVNVDDDDDDGHSNGQIDWLTISNRCRVINDWHLSQMALFKVGLIR